MRKCGLLVVAVALLATACGKEDFPFGPSGGPGEMPGEQQGVSNLKDPGLLWSADSFEAIIGGENSFPTLKNTYSVDVTYASSQPEVATIDKNGVVKLLTAGSTLISASSVADQTYFRALSLVTFAPAKVELLLHFV